MASRPFRTSVSVFAISWVLASAGCTGSAESRESTPRPLTPLSRSIPPAPERLSETTVRDDTARHRESTYRLPHPHDAAGSARDRLDELVREIDRRLQERWEGLRGDSWSWAGAAPPEPAATPLSSDLEHRLVALSFLRSREHAGAVPEEAVDALLQRPADVEARLLAAAYLERSGRSEARNTLLRQLFRDVFGAVPAGGGGEPGGEALADAFRIEEAVFATEITGLGSYTARPHADFRAGERALVYGELVGLLREVEPGAGGDRHTGRVSASLTLRESSGRVVDHGTFLRRDRGVVRSRTPQDRVNFWAEYRFSPALSPGRYSLLIEARDLVGGTDARAEIPLRIVR